MTDPAHTFADEEKRKDVERPEVVTEQVTLDLSLSGTSHEVVVKYRGRRYVIVALGHAVSEYLRGNAAPMAEHQGDVSLNPAHPPQLRPQQLMALQQQVADDAVGSIATLVKDNVDRMERSRTLLREIRDLLGDRVAGRIGARLVAIDRLLSGEGDGEDGA